MPEQVLKIDPEHELKFKGPFTSSATSILKLTNPSDRRVCYKIKTTAPKRYCVRPNAGVLEPGSSTNIAVVFQPCDTEPSSAKHKFMVQSLFMPDGEVNTDTLWKEMDASKLMDTKLRCSFDPETEKEAVEERFTRKEDKTMTEDMGKKSGSGGDPRITQEFVLKHENIALKEEIGRLQQTIKRSSMGRPDMMVASPPAIPMVYIILGIAAVLLGLVLGKFVL